MCCRRGCATGRSCCLGRLVDRPVAAVAGERVAHHQHEHLHEAADRPRAARFPCTASSGFCDRQQDRSAQPRIAVEQFPRGPVVDRRAQAAAMSSLNSAIAPCSTLQIAILTCRTRRAPAGAAPSTSLPGKPILRPPVRPAAQRRVGRIAHQRERIAVDVAIEELVAPVVGQVRQQRRGRRHRRMDVAINRAGRNLHTAQSWEIAGARSTRAKRLPEP